MCIFYRLLLKIQGNCWQFPKVLECIKLSLGADKETVESLWVRIKEQANMRDAVVGVYYRPPDEDGETDEAFYRQLKVASQSHALVLGGGLQSP